MCMQRYEEKKGNTKKTLQSIASEVKKHYQKTFYWCNCRSFEIVFVPLRAKMRQMESCQNLKYITKI